MNEKNKNLTLRVLSAVLLLPGVIFLLLKGGLWSAALMGLASAVCTGEYYLITQGKLTAAAGVGAAVSFVMPWLPALDPRQSADLGFWMLAFFFVFAWTYQLLRAPLNEAVASVAHLITGLLYGALGLTALSALRNQPYGLAWVFTLLVATWGNDTFAYFVGRFLGKRKLYPEVSPNKTWEGFFGGLFGSLAGMFICKATFFSELSYADCFIVAAITGLIGPVGDLSESMLKRTHQVKDSGKLIPGHGGLLDRIDALLFNAPVTLLYVHFIRGAL